MCLLRARGGVARRARCGRASDVWRRGGDARACVGLPGAVAACVRAVSRARLAAVGFASRDDGRFVGLLAGLLVGLLAGLLAPGLFGGLSAMSLSGFTTSLADLTVLRIAWVTKSSCQK